MPVCLSLNFHWILRWLTSVAAVACTLLSAWALEPSRSVHDYRVTEWLATAGLPYPAVRALAQSGDGYLWVGTRAGLTRFDGENFTTYGPTNQPALSSDEISALACSSDGTLWIGTANGLVW